MGNLSKYTEKSFVLDGNTIKSRTVDFSIVYEYENEIEWENGEYDYVRICGMDEF